MNDCVQCGGCCKEQVVLLTFQDLRSIAKAFPDTDFQLMITLYVIDKDYQDVFLARKNYGSIRILNQFNQIQEYFIGMKFWSIPNGHSTCFFYNAFQKTCRVHSHKPMVCRTYPFALESNGVSLFYYGKCPTQPPMTFIETKEKVSLLVESQIAQENYRKEIKDWETNVKDSEKTIINLINYVLPLQNLPSSSPDAVTSRKKIIDDWLNGII